MTCSAPAGADPRLSESPSVYRPFLYGSILCTLTLGATFGAYNIYAQQFTEATVPAVHHILHAEAQVWGFVFLFIAGVAYHAVPRFFGSVLARPGLARATFWLAVSGLFLRFWGRFEHWFPFALPALVAGTILLTLAVLGFCVVLLDTARRARPPTDLSHPFLAAGTAWWVIAAGILCVGAYHAAVGGHAVYASRYNEAVYVAALYGGMLGWIEVMFVRTAPIFLGLTAPRLTWVKVALVAGQGGAVVALIGALATGDSWARECSDLGLLGVSLGAIAFVIGLRPFRSVPGVLGEGDRGFVRIIRLAFAFLVLFGLLAAGYSGAALAGEPPMRLLLDGARHAFTLGFVTLLLFGMASRIVPIFEGVALRWPAARTWGAWLIVAGALLREGHALAAIDFQPWMMSMAGWSGIVAATGVCLAGASILGTLRSGAHAALTSVISGDVAIAPDSNVAALVEAHPEAIRVLVEAGFAPIANPLMRRTLARAVTLRQACAMHGLGVETIVERIREKCPHLPSTWSV